MQLCITKNPDTQLIEFTGSFSQTDLHDAATYMSAVERYAAGAVTNEPGNHPMSAVLTILASMAQRVEEARALEPKSKVNSEGKTPQQVVADLTAQQMMFARSAKHKGSIYMPHDGQGSNACEELLAKGVFEYSGATDRYALKKIYWDIL